MYVNGIPLVNKLLLLLLIYQLSEIVKLSKSPEITFE